jgi:hypothetical protein
MKDTDSAKPPKRGAASSEAAAGTQGGNACPMPFHIRKRVGSTAYEVAVYFSAEGGETMDDKILRLVRGSVLKVKDGEK